MPFFILLLCASVYTSNSQARESFQFSASNDVQVLSDKAFRRTVENRFEAVGNVIITQGANTIYGEKASLSFETSDAQVLGNVRYVDDTMTMYGSQLDYNFNTQRLDVKNARILSDSYVVLGEQLSRIGENEIYGKDAEYSTCKDCPESWSVFGREIRITLGEYIRIRHAYIKVKGVVVMYIPYIILPIKKSRETGLLFPTFGLNVDEGVRFQQPFFWAISDQMDMTLTPSYFGNRGYGGEFEFRHTPRDGLWYQVDSFAIDDGIYLPGKENRKKSGTESFRSFGQWEHHFNTSSDFNHHFIYNQTRDFDFLRDFQYYATDKIFSSDTGAETFFEMRKDLFSMGIEVGYRENLLNDNAYAFDNSYVQVLPKVNLDLNTYQLLESDIPLLERISFGGHFDFTVFKQNNVVENRFIRNTHRFNAQPYIVWNLGQLGPVNISTKSEFDYQYYHFPTKEKRNWFWKQALIQETEASLTLDKIFGLAYKQVIPGELVVKNDEKKVSNSTHLMGDLPDINKAQKDTYEIIHNSYRHSQDFKLKHYFLSKQDFDGSTAFYNQIQEDNGLFDPIDTIRSQEFLAANETSKTTMPLNNTLEIQWNNRLLRKSAQAQNILADEQGLRDNFDYSNIGYFDISQGFDLYRKTDALGRELSFKERLTRLYINTGFTLDKTSFSFQEYYYWSTQENIFRANITQNFDNGWISGFARYNSFRVPTDKFVGASGQLSLSDLYTVSASWEYDLSLKRSNQSRYGVLYRPKNNCWIFELEYLKTIVEKRVSFNFLLNFGDGKGSFLN